MKIFEFPHLNVFTPDVEKGGRDIGGSSPCAGRRQIGGD